MSDQIETPIIACGHAVESWDPVRGVGWCKTWMKCGTSSIVGRRIITV